MKFTRKIAEGVSDRAEQLFKSREGREFYDEICKILMRGKVLTKEERMDVIHMVEKLGNAEYDISKRQHSYLGNRDD